MLEVRKERQAGGNTCHSQEEATERKGRWKWENTVKGKIYGVKGTHTHTHRRLARLDPSPPSNNW